MNFLVLFLYIQYVIIFTNGNVKRINNVGRFLIILIYSIFCQGSQRFQKASFLVLFILYVQYVALMNSSKMRGW